MSLVLKRFSQDVDMGRPDVVLYFLVFQDTEKDTEIRLPVLKETTEALVRHLYGGGQEKKAEEETPPAQQDDEDFQFVDPPDGEPPEAPIYEDGNDNTQQPSTEDDIPSL